MHCLRSFFAAALASAALFLSASAQAAPVFDFSPDDPPDTTEIFPPDQITLGYWFDVTGGGISVDGIGIFDFDSDGLASAHQVALWDIGGTLVIDPQMLNPGLPPSNSERSDSGFGSYIYVDIGPVPLDPGQYVLGVSYLPVGGNQDPDANRDAAANAPIPLIFQNAGNVMYGGGRFGMATGVTVMFPSLSSGGENYFGPALRISATIPEPLTLALLIIGMAGMGCSRRKLSLPDGSIPA